MAQTRADIGKSRRDRTRTALLDAARRVVARLGPDAAKIDDFIHEAGVARGTFYNYFDRTEDILEAVAIDVSEQLHDEMAFVTSLQDPADRVACMLKAFVAKAASDPVIGWVVVRIALVAAPLGPTMRANIRSYLEAGMASNRFRLPTIQAGQDLILGLGLFGMRSVLRGEAGPNHPEEIAQMALSALGVADASEIAWRRYDVAAIMARAAAPGVAKAKGVAPVLARRPKRAAPSKPPLPKAAKPARTRPRP